MRRRTFLEQSLQISFQSKSEEFEFGNFADFIKNIFLFRGITTQTVVISNDVVSEERNNE